MKNGWFKWYQRVALVHFISYSKFRRFYFSFPCLKTSQKSLACDFQPEEVEQKALGPYNLKRNRSSQLTLLWPLKNDERVYANMAAYALQSYIPPGADRSPVPATLTIHLPEDCDKHGLKDSNQDPKLLRLISQETQQELQILNATPTQ